MADEETVEQIVEQLGSKDDLPHIDESINEAYRWSEQCYLAHNLGNILGEFNDHRPTMHPRPWHYVTSVTSLNSDTSTANFMNRFHMAPDDVDFVNISTFERANMLWNMKLYKVFYKAVDTEATLKQWEYDCELPLIFESMAAGDMEDYKKNKKSNYHRSDGDDFGGKYKSRPQTGYGIKSFSWDYLGANPETVRNDIEAKLVIEFQNFNQLSKIRLADARKPKPGSPGKFDYDTDRKYSLLDLLGYGPNSDRNDPEQSSTYDPAFFEIKAVVEWQANEDVKSYDTLDPAKKTGKKTKKLKDKVKGQSTTLFLTLTDHSFSISQLGTFTLTLDYRARLESVASQMRANVLYEIESPVTVDAAGITSGGGPYTDLLAKDLEIKNATKNCTLEGLAALKAERLWLQRRAWSSGMAGIFNSSFKSDPNIKEYPVGLTYMSSRKRQGDVVLTKKKTDAGWSTEEGAYRLFTFQGLTSAAKEFIKGTPGVSTAFRVLASNESGAGKSSAAAAAEELAKAFADNDEGEAHKQLNSFFTRQLNWSKAHRNKDGKVDEEFLDVQIHFFYLGDLLNVMAHRAFSDQGFTTSGGTQLTGGSFGTAEKMKIIAGPVNLKDPADPSKTIRCSLSDLPISVEVFADFWYRNVIQTQRPVYSFMEFVRDLGEQVINKAFGEGCIEDTHNSLDGQTRLKTGFLSLPQHSSGEDPLLHLKGDPYDDETGDLIAELMNGPGANIYDPAVLAATAPNQIYNYVVLWLENQESSLVGLNGDEKGDAEKGIYHLKIHQGILQSIDFQKTDQPYLRETRFTMLHEDPLVHLSNVYNVRASMVGNTCFYPGDIVYINPVGFGTSLGKPMDKQSLSRVMGLGGYHTIVSVSNKVSRDFTTEIEALWTSNSGVKPEKLSCEEQQKAAATVSTLD